MISPLAKLACKRDELDGEIRQLCSKLGQLTQERFVINEAIRQQVNEPMTYQILKRHET